MGLGERFRTAREERGLTISEVGEQLHIRSVYLAAIEEQNWKAIGAAVYTRGFLRTYARFLGLDPEEAVAEFNAASGAVPLGDAPAVPPPAPGQRSLGPLIWFAAAIAAGLIGFVIYLYVSPPRASGGSVVQTTAATTAQPSPAATQTAHPAPRPQPRLERTLAIHITSASWLRVIVDGNVSIEGTFPRGTSKTFHGKTALVRAGNAAGVQIIVNGKPAAKLGGVGDVVEKAYTL